MLQSISNWFLKRPNLTIVTILTLIVGASSWSLLHPEFFRVHDYVHAARIAEMLRALQEGHVPARWSGNFGYGYGMPVFEFYAPLPFYVGALFYWLGVPIITVLKLLWLLCSVATAIGAYYLGQLLFGKRAGLVMAAALTLAPYRAVNLFVRGSLSEAWGIMALPWVLYGGLAIVKGKAHGWWVLTLSLVVLMLSHNLTTLMFVPVSGLLCLGYMVWRWYFVPTSLERSWRTEFAKLLKLAGSYILAIGLSSFYLLPAFVEKDFTKIDSILSGYFWYSHHFLYIRQFFRVNWKYGGSAWGPDDEISFFLGFTQLASLVVIGFGVLWQGLQAFKQKQPVYRRQLFSLLFLSGLFSLVLGLSLFMSLQKSEPIWNAVHLLSFIQFPWRWLSVAILALSLLAGLSLSVIPSLKWKNVYALLFIAVTIVSSAWMFKPESWMGNADDLYYTDATRIRSSMSGILPDYIPKQMNDKLVPPTAAFLVPGGLESNVEVIVNHGHERLLKTKLMNPVELQFTIADFPGWTVEIDGEVVPKITADNGTVAVLVPAGEHLVGAYFGSTPIRLIADTTTMISLLVLIFGLVKLKKVSPPFEDGAPAANPMPASVLTDLTVKRKKVRRS